MRRVKQIICDLYRLAVKTLPAVVKPNENQRQNRKTLLRKSKAHAIKQHEINKPQREKLQDSALCRAAAEQIKGKQGQNSCAGIIDPCDIGGGKRGGKHRATQNGGFSLGRFKPLKRPNAAKPENNSPDDILPVGVKHRAADKQVKRHLRNEGEQRKPEQIFFKATGVKTALDRHERKQRKGEPADAAQQGEIWHQCEIQVVAQHESHRRYMQRK